jgi:hypothetical protein
MTPQVFIDALRAGEKLDFEDTIAVINAAFEYTPTPFSNGLSNGAIINEAGKNEGSCKIFAFAQLMALDEATTLKCFGRFYQDVLNTPDANDHQNIRNFMKDGWAGITFNGHALQPKPAN